ncbi:hypothetical protein EUX98_g877 [Antrodiella citrinella]|uniref:Alpha/beta hydrolase fold-3 domain-containing protein n=1 Tax=Antrodiella citrinella TaxID=2447956 RepID=A0A4S4N2X4_9APHY|nr:hypothetical protein EUX98_g877 [Antrodiella citrinella]
MDLEVYALRQQPFRAIYIVVELLITVFIRLPYWLILYIPRHRRPRVSWPYSRCIAVEILRTLMFVGPIAARAGPISTKPDHRSIPDIPGVKALWIDPTPDLLFGDVNEWADAGNIPYVRLPGYWYDRHGDDTPIGTAPHKGEKVLYMIKGGAFVGLSAHPDYTFGPMFRRLVGSHPLIRRGFSVEYRLTTGPPLEHEHPFPTALMDVLAGYAYLTDHVGFAPEDIVVEGDSSGGNLAIALVRYLIENGTEKNHLPGVPGGLILVSPWVDLGDSHDDHPECSQRMCLSSDYLPGYGSPMMVWARKHYCSVVGYPEATNSNRYISPASIDHDMEHVSFKGFPRTLIVYGDAEVLHDQVVTLRDRMVDDLGGEWVRHHVVKDGIHAILVMPWFNFECKAAFEAIDVWLKETWIGKESRDVSEKGYGC